MNLFQVELIHEDNAVGIAHGDQHDGQGFIRQRQRIIHRLRQIH